MVEFNDLTSITPIGADKFLVIRNEVPYVCTGEQLKAYVGGGTATEFIEVTGSGDDAGLICTGQWSVGKPGAGRESVFGEGDSYGVGKEDTTPEGTPVAGSAWHCDISNTSGATITNATDVTAELSSDSGSTSPLFNGTTAGNYLLVGSEHQFGGFKAKIDTLGDVAAGSVAMEFLFNGTTWTEYDFMATDSSFPYTQKANVIGSCSSCSEQWRVGINPIAPPTTWNKVTLTINGSDYTKYWFRIRLTDTITTDIVLQQLKCHTDRFEINAEGSTEYFGRSRYAKDIIITKSPNADKNPIDENIKIASGITAIRTDNEFKNGANDGLILQGVLPNGVDTSIPIQIIVDWYPRTNITGDKDIKLQLEVASVRPGDILDGNNPVSVSTPIITTVNNQAGEIQRSTFLVNVNNTLPGDIFFGSLFRNSNDTQDTYNANIVISGWRVIGYFWRP